MHIVLILLPATAYTLLTLIFAPRTEVREILEALVKGYIILFVFIALSTELLSPFHWISFSPILTTWLLFLQVCSFALFKQRGKRDLAWPLPQGVAPLRLTPLKLMSVGAIALILLTTFSTALLYPPNNWDSMTYHMSRVAHWVSDSTVSFYPTAITRQNYQMPLAEFAILHIQILTGCDLYANLIQWMSFLTLICLAPLIAWELGLSDKQQLTSALIIATLPMAILQASSTQNDLVVSSFLLSFALFMLRLRKNLSSENLLFATISLGLALLTKGTAFLYGATIGASLAVPVLMGCKSNRPRFSKAAIALLSVVIVAFLMNSGHLSRNYRLYGHPLSTEGEAYRNKEASVATLASNILRNGALHLGTPFDQINQYQLRALQVVLGSQLNNPKTTWPNYSFTIPATLHEDTAGNLLHMLIAMFAVAFLLFTWARGHHKSTVWYAVGIMVGALLYCWILKWQPWASRLHTPLFALAAPLLAITITSDTAGIRGRIAYLIILCLALSSIPFALRNSSRPLLSSEWHNKNRMQLYFENRSDLYNEYKSVMKILGETNSEEVGLYLGEDDWEYPFWALADRVERSGRTMSFNHVGVSNISRRTNKDLLLPPYVIATKPIGSWKHAPKYTAVHASDHLTLFRKLENINSHKGSGNPLMLHFPP